MSSELWHVYHSLAVRRSVLYLDFFPQGSNLIERVVIVSGHLLLKCSRRHVDQQALQTDLIVMGCQSLMMRCASAQSPNQCSIRQPSRLRPLKPSTNTF